MSESPHSLSLSLGDLFQAYWDCRKGKKNTINALAFEVDYEHQLLQLWDEIQSRTYRPGRSIAFIVNQPVKREIFAADFRDRVVHHFIINQLNPFFEHAFILDSYSCRQDKGTHFGILRAARFIRQCSQNYTKDCFVLKLDIQGFFMAIDKGILWCKLHEFIEQYYLGEDHELLLFLCHQILNNNPTKNCFIKSSCNDWNGLPPDKSLFYSMPHCGLPIGNLTSQIFANFYLNALDHFMKYDLGLRYYGRYVDDFLVVHEDKDHLKKIIPIISIFLKNKLKLTLHPRKVYLQHYTKGVAFLGVYLKPNYILSGRRLKGNFYNAIVRHNQLTQERKPTKDEQAAFLCSMNSYLGIMKHYNTYRLRRRMLRKHLSIWWWNLMYLSGGASKLVPKQKTIR